MMTTISPKTETIHGRSWLRLLCVWFSGFFFGWVFFSTKACFDWGSLQPVASLSPNWPLLCVYLLILWFQPWSRNDWHICGSVKIGFRHWTAVCLQENWGDVVQKTKTKNARLNRIVRKWSRTTGTTKPEQQLGGRVGSLGLFGGLLARMNEYSLVFIWTCLYADGREEANWTMTICR